MTTLGSLGKVISTDILVIGGGIAGLSAAISAKETSPDIDILVPDSDFNAAILSPFRTLPR